jgi:hypothetical protein
VLCARVNNANRIRPGSNKGAFNALAASPDPVHLHVQLPHRVGWTTPYRPNARAKEVPHQDALAAIYPEDWYSPRISQGFILRLVHRSFPACPTAVGILRPAADRAFPSLARTGSPETDMIPGQSFGFGGHNVTLRSGLLSPENGLPERGEPPCLVSLLPLPMRELGWFLARGEAGKLVISVQAKADLEVLAARSPSQGKGKAVADLFNDPGAKHFVPNGDEGQHSPWPILNGADIAFSYDGAAGAAERDGLARG